MEIKVTVLPAKHWYSFAKFRTEEEFTMLGITVPRGYVFDGATVSRWLTIFGLIVILSSFYFNNIYGITTGCFINIIPVIFPKISTYFAATLVHDFLIKEERGTRRNADKIFRRCLVKLNVKPWRYNSMYLAVRIFGVLKDGIKFW
jgi:hypothetical protein